MDGQATLGVGLAILGFAAPITAAIMRFLPLRNGQSPAKPAAEQPGTGPVCRKHGEQLERLDANQGHLRELLERIDQRTARIEQALYNA